MTKKEKKTLVKALKPLSIIGKEEGFPQPEHYSEPIQGLEIHDVFQCNKCDFISRSADMMRRHEWKSHSEPKPSGFESNSSQRWRALDQSTAVGGNG